MLCNVVLVSTVQHESAVRMHIFPLSLPPSLPTQPLCHQRAKVDLAVLSGCSLLASYFTLGSVFMSMLLSQFVHGVIKESDTTGWLNNNTLLKFTWLKKKFTQFKKKKSCIKTKEWERSWQAAEGVEVYT